jgi:lysophospholipase L1-like esterase
MSALGASQVANAGSGLTLEGDGFFAHLIWAGGGRWRHHPVEAAGSENLTQTLARVANFDGHLALYGAMPSHCVIQVGRNDMTSTDHAAKLALVGQIIDGLLSRGILPIVTELLPAAHNSLYADHVQLYNTGLCNLCAQRGIPFIRYPLALIDQADGGLPDAYHVGDNTHLNVTGAKLFGDAVAATLRDSAGVLIPWEPMLVRTNDAETAAALKLANPLMLADANSDGIPDGRTIDATDAGSLSKALVSAASDGLAGNWFAVTKTATTGDTVVQAQMSTAITVGNVWAFGWAVKLDYASGTDGYAEVRVRNQAGATLFRERMQTNADLGVAKRWVIRDIPAGSTRIDVQVLHNIVGTVSLAEVTMMDLTAAGIAAYR